MDLNRKIFRTIPVQLPEKKVYSRLGYNFHLTDMTDQQRKKISEAINTGFAYCEPSGVYLAVAIRSKNKNFIELETGDVLTSASLATLLENSHAVLLMAATVGPAIMTEIEKKMQAEDAVTALVYDAVGSETADTAVGWINEYVRQLLPRNREMLTKFRYSPGYGDLGLENQKIIYDLLMLQEFNITLTKKFLMIPEKSVIAIAGIEEMRTVAGFTEHSVS